MESSNDAVERQFEERVDLPAEAGRRDCGGESDGGTRGELSGEMIGEVGLNSPDVPERHGCDGELTVGKPESSSPPCRRQQDRAAANLETLRRQGEMLQLAALTAQVERMQVEQGRLRTMLDSLVELKTREADVVPEALRREKPCRPRVLTDDVQNLVICHLAAGLSLRQIAEQVGCHHTTIFHLARRDPEFGKRVEMAREVGRTMTRQAG